VLRLTHCRNAEQCVGIIAANLPLLKNLFAKSINRLSGSAEKRRAGLFLERFSRHIWPNRNSSSSTATEPVFKIEREVACVHEVVSKTSRDLVNNIGPNEIVMKKHFEADVEKGSIEDFQKKKRRR
jgi:hypothetical protein